MSSLIPFAPEYFSPLISWIPTESMLVQFAGPIFSYPLTHAQLHKYLEDPMRKAYTLLSTPEELPIGHGEVYLKGDQKANLSRLIIAPESRGKGLGEYMIRELIQSAQYEFQVKELRLKVYDWNISAIQCYLKIGFQIALSSHYQTPIGNEVWKAHEMVLVI